MRSLKEVNCQPRRGQRGNHIITLSPSTRQQSDITRFYTVRKHLPPLNTLNSALVGDLSFAGSVETLGKRFGLLVYCTKQACDDRKVIVKKKKYCSTANSRTGVMISFKLMRPGWIPATPLKNLARGRDHWCNTLQPRSTYYCRPSLST